MGIESILIILLIGAIAGWLAGQIVSGFGYGLLGNIVIGIVGAFIAGAILPRVGFGFGGGILGGDRSRDHRCGDFAVLDQAGQTRLKSLAVSRCANK